MIRFVRHCFAAILLVLFACHITVCFSQHGVIDYYAALAPTREAVPLAPLLDIPLTDTSITVDTAGVFYMTGSSVKDEKAVFSKTVVLWNSTDQKNWNVLRKIEYDVPVSAPEIHFLNGVFYVTLGREGGGTDLLQFDTVNLKESPFRSAVITKTSFDPSIFRDDDGTFYWVCGEGYVGQMKPNPLDGLAVAMTCVMRPYPLPVTNERPNRVNPNVNQNDRTVRSTQMRGAFLTKIKGYYHLFVGERRLKFGEVGRTGLVGGTDDVFVAVSSKPDSGYDESYRYMAFPCAGQTTLFRAPTGELWATFSCTDSRGIFRNQPGAFPVEIVDASKSVWSTGFAGDDPPVLYSPHHIMLRPSRNFVYENGVGLVRPIPFDRVPSQQRDIAWVRDTNITCGGDGCFYMTGTTGDMDSIHIWKSTDLKKFDYFTEAYRLDTPENNATAWYNQKVQRLLWAPEIHFLDNQYWIVFSINSGLGMGFLKSQTGKPDGPYRPMYSENRAFVAPNIDSSLFMDDDGSKYFIWQGKFLQKITADGSRLLGERKELLTVDGEQVGYEGIFLRKIGEWYVLCAAEWNGGSNRMDGTYDTMFAVSKTLEGPYSSRKVLAPHTGHSSLVQDSSGKWYLAFFGNDRTAPFRASAGVVPLTVRSTPANIVIEVDTINR